MHEFNTAYTEKFEKGKELGYDYGTCHAEALKYAERAISMQCGACGGEILVTEGQWKYQDTAPCPHCPDGGADLVHARQHADEF